MEAGSTVVFIGPLRALPTICGLPILTLLLWALWQSEVGRQENGAHFQSVKSVTETQRMRAIRAWTLALSRRLVHGISREAFALRPWSVLALNRCVNLKRLWRIKKRDATRFLFVKECWLLLPDLWRSVVLLPSSCVNVFCG